MYAQQQNQQQHLTVAALEASSLDDLVEDSLRLGREARHRYAVFMHELHAFVQQQNEYLLNWTFIDQEITRRLNLSRQAPISMPVRPRPIAHPLEHGRMPLASFPPQRGMADRDHLPDRERGS